MYGRKRQNVVHRYLQKPCPGRREGLGALPPQPPGKDSIHRFLHSILSSHSLSISLSLSHSSVQMNKTGSGNGARRAQAVEWPSLCSVVERHHAAFLLATRARGAHSRTRGYLQFADFVVLALHVLVEVAAYGVPEAPR